MTLKVISTSGMSDPRNLLKAGEWECLVPKTATFYSQNPQLSYNKTNRLTKHPPAKNNVFIRI